MDIRQYLISDNVMEAFAIYCILATFCLIALIAAYKNFIQSNNLKFALNETNNDIPSDSKKDLMEFLSNVR